MAGPGCALATLGLEWAASWRVVTPVGENMGKRDHKILALPPGVRFGDFEWEPLDRTPAPRRKSESKPEKKSAAYFARLKRRNKARQETVKVKKAAFRQVQAAVKQLAKVIAFDLLEIRAEQFTENEKAWREQQQREAKAYAAKLSAAFRDAVKEAAGKS